MKLRKIKESDLVVGNIYYPNIYPRTGNELFFIGIHKGGDNVDATYFFERSTDGVFQFSTDDDGTCPFVRDDNNTWYEEI